MPSSVVSGGPWDSFRLESLKLTFTRVLNNDMDVELIAPEMHVSVEFLRPMWNYLIWAPNSVEAQDHLLTIYLASYLFPHASSLHAALLDTGISVDIFRDSSPAKDKLSTSVQCLVEAGYWGEGIALMIKRCHTKESKSYGLDKYWARLEDVQSWPVDEWGV